MKLIEYDSIDEYYKMFEALIQTYKCEIVYKCFDTATHCFWTVNCFEEFRKDGFEAFMKLFKYNEEYTMHAQANADMIAYGLTCTAKTFVRHALPKMPFGRLLSPKSFFPEHKIQLLSELHDCINDFDCITQHHDNNLSLEKFRDDHFIWFEDILQSRTKCHMVMAMGLHKRLGETSPLRDLSLDTIQQICTYL